MANTLKKKMIFGFIIIICALIAFISILFVKRSEKNIVTTAESEYDATKAIAKAMDKLKGGSEEAEVIKDIQTAEKIAALTFKGLSDVSTNRKILDLMTEYGRKATFFVPGILAAEDSDTVVAMNSEGHKIGSNTLLGSKHMEEYSQEDLVRDFSMTNTIIQTLVSEAPTVLMTNATTYTPEVLRAAYASGNEKVVESTHFLSYQSFTSYNQVLGYIKGLNEGTIITVKMEGTLDEEEYDAPEEVSSPATDKRPDVETQETKLDASTKEERLLKVVEWLLQALEETEVKTVFVEDLAAYDDSDFDMNFDDLRKQNDGKLSKVYTKVETNKKSLAFSFRGVEDEEKLNEILDFLEENELTATFFVTGKDIVNYPDRIQGVLDKKHTVANGGMTDKDFTAMSFNDICLEIYKGDKLLKEVFDVHTEIFMPVYGKYNDLVREAASTLDYSITTYSKNAIIDKSKSIDEIMNYYKNGFQKGDIIYFKIGFYEDLLNVVKKTYETIGKGTYEIWDIPTLIASQSNEKTAATNKGSNTTTKISGITKYDTTQKSIDDQDITKSSIADKDIEENSSAIEETGNSIIDDKTDFELVTYTTEQIEELRSKNNTVKAKEINTVHTTEQALSYTFYGISHTDVLEDVLAKLDILNAKGTFFVTQKDLVNYADEVKKIAKKGHEIGICLETSTGTDFYSVVKSILAIQQKVEYLCGQKPTLVRYAYNLPMTDEMLEAISTAGCMFVTQDLSLASSKLGVDATLEEAVRGGFNDGNVTVRRGYIIYYRMDYYSDSLLIGNLMMDVAKNRIDTIAYYDGFYDNGSAYSIKTLGSLLKGDKVYTYPVEKTAVLPFVKDAIQAGQLEGQSEASKFKYIQGRYIGTPSVNTTMTLPGFKDQELEELDKTGRFTNDKVLFLTFDDWGSDKTITQLLYVLKKYDVEADFFVRTSSVQYNPNLLRAIAEAGHDIGSHTEAHLPFTIASVTNPQTEDDTIYSSLSDTEIAQRKEDLVISYNKLQSIIGDVQVDGLSALTKIFRPPTLAMSKGGMEAIFDMGFTYIVSGDFSTHDYDDTSPKVLANKIINGITLNNGEIRKLENGSVLVMHMSDDSIIPSEEADVTAKALDSVIPKLKAQGYSFEKLSDYLPDSKGSVYPLSETYTEWLDSQTQTNVTSD